VLFHVKCVSFVSCAGGTIYAGGHHTAEEGQAATAAELYHLPTLSPHPGVANESLALAQVPEEDDPQPLAEVICDERLGGLLRHYRRAA
jgi:hypothetical protein